MTSDSIKIKIYFLQNSEARNYLESQERLFISTILKNLENIENYKVDEKQSNQLKIIFEKYKKYLS